MKYIVTIFLAFLGGSCLGQVAGTASPNKIVVHEDYRMDLLEKKEFDVNSAIINAQARLAQGYRLMVLNTNDRAYAMRIRSKLLEEYPDQKTYMWFSSPYIKIKFGNFRTLDEANRYRDEISRMMNGANIYVIQETIEVKPDKDQDTDDPNAN